MLPTGVYGNGGLHTFCALACRRVGIGEGQRYCRPTVSGTNRTAPGSATPYGGLLPLDLNQPVRHISYNEAAAFAALGRQALADRI